MHAVQVCRCTNQFYLYSRLWFTLSVACMKYYLSQLAHSSAAVSKWCAVVLYNNTVVSPLVASYVDRAARDAGTVADIYGSHQESREIFDPIFSVQVRAYSSRKSWRLQFHNSELYFRNRPPNLCSHRRCERDFVLIPTHFYHATTCFCTTFCQLTCRTA